MNDTWSKFLDDVEVANKLAAPGRPNLLCDPEISGSRSRGEMIQAPRDRSLRQRATHSRLRAGLIGLDDKQWAITERLRFWFS